MKENRKEPLAPVPASTSSRSSLTPEREQRILLAAHYYHEKSKVKGNRCPYCGTEFTAMQDCIRKSCPQCGKAWTPEQKVRLNQDEVAELMRTPIYRPSRSEVQRLLSEAEEHG